jgi:hypothetical protein
VLGETRPLDPMAERDDSMEAAMKALLKASAPAARDFKRMRESAPRAGTDEMRLSDYLEYVASWPQQWLSGLPSKWCSVSALNKGKVVLGALEKACKEAGLCGDDVWDDVREALDKIDTKALSAETQRRKGAATDSKSTDAETAAEAEADGGAGAPPQRSETERLRLRIACMEWCEIAGQPAALSLLRSHWTPLPGHADKELETRETLVAVYALLTSRAPLSCVLALL